MQRFCTSSLSSSYSFVVSCSSENASIVRPIGSIGRSIDRRRARCSCEIGFSALATLPPFLPFSSSFSRDMMLRSRTTNRASDESKRGLVFFFSESDRSFPGMTQRVNVTAVQNLFQPHGNRYRCPGLDDTIPGISRGYIRST